MRPFAAGDGLFAPSEPVFFIPAKAPATASAGRAERSSAVRFQCSHCQAILDIEDCEPGELVQCGQCESAVAAPLSATSPGALIGDFIIKRELGVGGMGTVYLAHQATLDRDVAIKVLRANFAADEAFIESFIREARAAAAVNHPNIVQAYAVNSESGLFYFAMEFIDGKTLKQSLAERGRLPAAEVIDIAQDIVAALGFAWKERQIVHRDVKPDNIMMANTGHAKLADLGLARKITETNPDGSSELFGTPQYIAPELLFGYSPDARSDIYSLGCTLYHLVSGQCPFDGMTPEEVVNKHLFTPMTPLLDVAPDAPPGLAAMIELMTAKRPAQRYPDYDLIAADLKLIKAGRMPAHLAAPDAQHPIDGNSDNPFAVPDGSETLISHGNATPPSAKKKMIFSATPKPPSATGSPATSATGSPATGEAGSDSSQSIAPVSGMAKRKMLIIAGAIVLLLALGGGGAWFAMSRDSGAGGEAGGATTDGGTKDSVASVKAMISAQKPEAEILAELNRLAVTMAPGKAGYNDFLAVAAPYVEKALAQAREADITAEKERWQALAQTAKAEAERLAAEEAKKTEEAKKAEAEALRLAEAEAETQRQLERLNEQKNALRDQMLQAANSMDFSGARILFSPMLASNDPAAKAWAELWTNVLNDADKYYKLLRNSKEKLAGVKIPVLADKIKWEIDSIVFDKVNLKRVRQVYKDGQDRMEELTDSIEIDQLLFPQLEVVNHKLAETESLSSVDVGKLCANFLLARGAYLALIAGFLQKLGAPQELQDEVATLNGQYYMQSQLEFLRKLTKVQATALDGLLKNSDPTAYDAVADEVQQIIGGK